MFPQIITVVREIALYEFPRVFHYQNSRPQGLYEGRGSFNEVITWVVLKMVSSKSPAEPSAWGARNQNIKLTTLEVRLAHQLRRRIGADIRFADLNSDVCFISLVALKGPMPTARLAALVI